MHMRSEHTKLPLRGVSVTLIHEGCWTSRVDGSVIESMGRTYYPEEGKIRAFMVMSRKDLRKVVDLRREDKIKGINNVSRLGDRFLVDMSVEYRGSILEVLNHHRVLALNMSNINGREKWSFIAYEHQVPEVVEDLRRRGEVESVSVSELDAYVGGLTQGEQRVLNYAFYMGYFDYPRKVKMGEIASALGIRKSTLVYHLRRAERKILGNFLAKGGASP
jgi:predicted DNA binding protein